MKKTSEIIDDWFDHDPFHINFASMLANMRSKRMDAPHITGLTSDVRSTYRENYPWRIFRGWKTHEIKAYIKCHGIPMRGSKLMIAVKHGDVTWANPGYRIRALTVERWVKMQKVKKKELLFNNPPPNGYYPSISGLFAYALNKKDYDKKTLIRYSDSHLIDFCEDMTSDPVCFVDGSVYYLSEMKKDAFLAIVDLAEEIAESKQLDRDMEKAA